MSRLRKKYSNGQSRGTGSKAPARLTGRTPKDYHRQEVAFHGGEMNYEKWIKNGRVTYKQP